MAADQALTPSSYISHHLTQMARPVGEGGFWVLHVDTIVVSVLLGLLSFGALWLVVIGAASAGLIAESGPVRVGFVAVGLAALLAIAAARHLKSRL